MATPTFSYAVGQPVPFPCLRTTEGRFYSASGYLYSAQPFVPRDQHYLNGVPHLLVEGKVTNIFRDSENLNTANYTKTLCSIGGSVMTPDAVPSNRVSGIIANSGTVAAKVVSVAQVWQQSSRLAIAMFAKAGNKSNFFIQTTNKAGAVATSWVNLTTGTPGTTAATHVTPLLWPLANGWYRIEMQLTSTGFGGVGQTIGFGASDADNSLNVTGDGVTVNAYCWGRQSQTIGSGGNWPSSYIPNPGSGTATRASDGMVRSSHSVPQTRTIYADTTETTGFGPQQPAGAGSYFALGSYNNGTDDFGLGQGTANGYATIASINSVVYESPNVAISPAGTRVELRGSVSPTTLDFGIAINGGAESVQASTPVVDVFGPAYLVDDAYAISYDSAFDDTGIIAIRRVADFIGPSITLQDCRDGFVAAPVPPSPPTPTLCHNLPFHTYERVKKFWGMPSRHGGHI